MLDPWADGERGVSGTSSAAAARPPSSYAFDADEVVTSAPPVVRDLAARAAVKSTTYLAASLATNAPSMGAPSGVPSLVPAIDLSKVDAFIDVPDDARDAFARGAAVCELARGQQVTGFALALVIEGSVDVMAVTADAPAMRLHAGAVVRGRGTLEPATPLRLVASSDGARIGTWDEREIESAFGSCPWVEDDLRVAGDRIQALVGVTMGRLGDRLDAALRDQVTSRLIVRVLIEHEVFTRAGEPISGLLVVGAGELEVSKSNGTRPGSLLRPGDFLFPMEVLRAAVAPADVRASRGGALVLVADRALAQELLMTVPPLLEILSLL
jgi:hypothetical protein